MVGAGLPRTGTYALKFSLELLLRAPCCHMSAIPGHPFNLGDGWDQAIAGRHVDWRQLLAGFTAAVDWPTARFWRELSDEYPDALVLLSVRNDAQSWWESMGQTLVPYVRRAIASGQTEGGGLSELLRQFAQGENWDDPALMMAAYNRHNDEVRNTVPARRLLEWRASDGWHPLCRALGVPIPGVPFPWINKRKDWINAFLPQEVASFNTA